jgi:hypothetical protein
MVNMKKTLFFALITMLGCSKKETNPTNSQKKCYTIKFGSSVGGPACDRKSPFDTCIDASVNLSSLKFLDKCNNELSWIIN